MLTVYSHFFGTGGWQRYARALVAALSRRIPIALARRTVFPIPPGEEVSPAVAEMVARGAVDRPDGVALGMGPLELMPHLVGRVKIAFVLWETTRIPPTRLAYLRGMDEIWTPTEWGRELLVANAVPAERVQVVPLGVDPEAFFPPEVCAPVGPNGRFRFLSVGKWEERKATPELVRAFSETFAPSDPVELYLHGWNPMFPHLDLDTEVRRIARSPHAPIVTGGHLGERDLLSLYQGAQAFVLPTRGEGWGLPILEAMACGLPVIVTDYGAHRTFLSDESAYRLRVEGMREVQDRVFFREGGFGQWAQPDFAHLRELLRHVAEHPAEVRARGRAAREAALRWTWDHAAEIALARLARWSS